MMDNSDIAIQITNRLMFDVTKMCAEVTATNENSLKQTPSYYMIRHLLHTKLEEYIKICSFSYTYSPIEVERMVNKTDYWGHVMSGVCSNVSEEIFNKNYFHAWDYKNADNFYGSRRFSIAVIDLNNICKDNGRFIEPISNNLFKSGNISRGL